MNRLIGTGRRALAMLRMLLAWDAWRHRAVRWGAFAVLALGAFVGVLGGVVLQALKPAPDEWSHTLDIPTPLGRLQRQASVPVLLRWGMHPLAALVLEGRTLDTRAGRWRLHYGAADVIEADCMPCTVHVAALGDAPLRINRARLHVKRLSPEQWEGVLLLGEAAPALHVPWRAHLQPQQLDVHAELAGSALSDVLVLFGDAVPEQQRAQIDGRLALRVDANWSPRGWTVTRMAPRIDGERVAGLGTEALIDASVPTQCMASRSGRVEGWLPHAVVAAEDQRFYEHVGYDLEEWLAAWQANARRADELPRSDQALRGGSTLTEQLAKLVFTGDERSVTRKLREWLYAVEMERTLGKGRILQTYLAIAPWGQGVCGAEAAAQHYLHKPASRLTPHEAAWLASLLVNPDAQAAAWAQPRDADTQRVAAIVMAMPRLPRERKEQEVSALAGWSPLRGSLPRRPSVLQAATAGR